MNCARFFCVLLIAFASYCHAGELPMKVRDVRWNVPYGVAHSLDQEIEVTLDLENTGKASIIPGTIEWQIAPTRAGLGPDPTSIWEAVYNDEKKVASGRLEGEDDWLSGSVRTFTIRFKPVHYGYYSVLLGGEEAPPAYRAAGVAVIRPPAKGQRKDSPFLASGNVRLREGDTRSLGIASRLGIKWMRASLDANGKIGEYDWTAADKLAAGFREHEIFVLGDVGSYPGPVPTLGGKVISYFKGRKANLLPRPEDFPAYRDYVKEVVGRYSDIMPAAYVRNEPWEGGSISNYHATGRYYRELLSAASQGARAAGKDFILLGNDQITNFEDNIQSAPGTEKLIDATSHHTSWTDWRGAVQSAAAGLPAWETEDWQSPYDAFVIASMTMKLVGGYLKSNPATDHAYVMSPGAEKTGSEYSNRDPAQSPSPLSQPIATWLHFIEDTAFSKRLAAGTLPWMALFEGREGSPGRHVAVVIGRIKNYGHLYKEGEGDAAWPQVHGAGLLAVSDADQTLEVFDIQGNPLPRKDKSGFEIPLTEDAFYVVSSKGAAEVEKKLVAAKAAYEGQVFHTAFLDFPADVSSRPPVRLTIQNALNRPMVATVSVEPPEGWKLAESTQTISALAPGETRTLSFTVEKASASGANAYPFLAKVSSSMGDYELKDTLHSTVFRRGTITVDGKLDDWQAVNALPVTIHGGKAAADATEKYWFPFLKLQDGASGVYARFAGLWDDDYFYVSAEVHDPSGTFRPSMAEGIQYLVHGAPHDYLYWWRPRFPGSEGDSLKIAFNLFPLGQKNDPWIPAGDQKLLEPRLRGLSADYEYDIYLGARNRLKTPYEEVLARHLERVKNPPDEAYAKPWPPFEEPAFEDGGEPLPEVWRLMAPGVPRSNHYPFSPRRELDQALVPKAKVVVKRTGTTWVYEAAIPWSELSEVKPGPGREVAFTFSIQDDGRRALAWTAGRSSSTGSQLLHPTWLNVESIGTLWTFEGATPENPQP